MSKLKKGDEVWIDCKIKPGPFPNERLVLIELPPEPYVGFADVEALKNPDLEEGDTYVLARIDRIEGNIVTAAVLGHAVNSHYVQTSLDQVYPVVPITS